MTKKNETSLVQHAASNGKGELAAWDAAGNDSPGAETTGARCRRLIRRRPGLTIALCIVLGSAGAAGGWFLGHQQYSSMGEILVSGYGDDLIDGPLGGGGAPADEASVATELEFLKSSRVTDRALASKAWRDLGIGQSRDRLVSEVTFATQAQTIAVTMKDISAKVAATGVQAILDAYEQLHAENEIQRYKDNLDFLQGELAASMNRQAGLNSQMRVFAKYPGFATYGVDDLPLLFAEKLRLASDLERGLQDVRWQISAQNRMFAPIGAQPTTQPAGTRPSVMMAGAVTESLINQIAKNDTQMAGYLSRKQQLEDFIVASSVSLGTANPAVRNARNEIDALNAEMQRFAAQYLFDEQRAAAGDGGGEYSPIDQLRTAESNYVTQLKAANADIEAITQLRRDVADLHEQLAEEELNHQALQAHIVGLDRLSRRPERVRVIQDAQEAERPSFDTRPLLGAGLGFAGILAAFGGVLGIGFAERRLREPGDTGGGETVKRPILGMLPDLPEGTEDLELIARSGECIHHVPRTSLQLWYGWIERPVIAISGPSAGAGKTTLALGLGLSFAVANSRTLLIDFDLAGGGLSRRARIMKRDRLGMILRRQGKLQLSQLKQGLLMASETGMKLGEALLKLNLVAESDLNEALLRQQERSLGVLDVLDGASLSRCVTETEVANLSVLGIGNALASDAGRVAPADVQRLLDECRKKYDVILIDTGPLPGSLEGAVVAALADGMILTVVRGELRSKLRRSIEYAARIGARLAGVVFNRATSRHLADSVFASSTSVRSPSAANGPVEAGVTDRFGLFGKSLLAPTSAGNGQSKRPA